MSMDDPQYDGFGEAPPPEESSNRTFLIAAGILGGIVLLSVACLAAYALIILPQQRAASQSILVSGTQTKEAENAFINQALTQTFEASILPTTTLTPPPTSTSPVNLATVTDTPGTSVVPPVGGVGTSAAATSTVAAALTQAAAAQQTIIVTSTSLPNTGFADDYGVPGLVVMGLAFVIVILLARRLRTSPVSTR